MPTRIKMQARSSVDGLLYSWLSSLQDWSGVGFTGPGTPLDVTMYSGPIESNAPVPIVCTLDYPLAGTFLAGATFSLSGTISRAGTVAIKNGATVLGYATVAGLSWTFDYVPSVAGSLNLSALATDAVNGTTATASTTVTIAASHSFVSDLTSLYQLIQTDKGLTYGGTLLDSSGAGPVLYLSGTLLGTPVPIWIKAVSTGFNNWNYIVYYDGLGVTPAMSGTVSGSTIALIGAGYGLTINVGAGSPTLGNIWKATCAGIADQSGNSQHYWQPDVTAQPLITAGLSGKPGLLFDGLDDVLDCLTLTLPNTAVTPWALFAVLRVITYNPSGRLFTAIDDNTALLWLHTASPQLEIFNGTSIGTSSGLAVGTWGALDAVFAANASAYLRAGSGAAQGFVSAGAGIGTGGRRIGGGNGSKKVNFELLMLAYAAPQSAVSFRSSVASYYGGVQV